MGVQNAQSASSTSSKQDSYVQRLVKVPATDQAAMLLALQWLTSTHHPIRLAHLARVMSFTKFNPAQNRQFNPAEALESLSDLVETIEPKFWCDGCGQLQKGSFYHCTTCMAANWDLCTDCVAAGKHCLVPDHKLDLVQYNAVYTARTRVYLKDSGLKTFLLSPEILDTDAKAFAINGETQSSVIETDELTFTLYRSDVFPPAASACALAIPKVAVDDTYRFPDGMAYDWKDGAWTTQLDWLNLDRDVERGINFGSLAVSFLARSGGWSKPESVVDSGLGKWRDLFAMSRFDGRFVLDLVVAVKK